MGIDVAVSGVTAIINIVGRFDFNLQRNFKSSYDSILIKEGVSCIDVNLAGVDYLDSSALGMLLMLRERALVAGKTIQLSKPTSSVAQVLEIANFGKLFTIV